MRILPQRRKPLKSKRLNTPRLNRTSKRNVLRFYGISLRCNRLHPVLDRQSGGFLGSPAVDQSEKSKSAQQLAHEFPGLIPIEQRKTNHSSEQQPARQQIPILLHAPPLSVESENVKPSHSLLTWAGL